MAKSKKTQVMEYKSFNLRLVTINLLSLNIERFSGQEIDLLDLKFNMNIEQRIAKDSRQVVVILNIKISDTPDNKTMYGEITVGCIFEIENILDYESNDKEKTIILPNGISEILYSIAISTTRGVIYSELKGTHLQGALLPIIDPSSLIKN